MIRVIVALIVLAVVCCGCTVLLIMALESRKPKPKPTGTRRVKWSCQCGTTRMDYIHSPSVCFPTREYIP